MACRICPAPSTLMPVFTVLPNGKHWRSSFVINIHIVSLAHNWQSYSERASLTFFRFDFDLAAVIVFDQELGDIQANAKTMFLCCIEHVEQFPLLISRNPDAEIPYGKRNMLIVDAFC
jgi:hypothetical protein